MTNNENTNIQMMISHLHECAEAINDLIHEIESGEHSTESDTPPVLAIPYSHIMSHLCASWHWRWMTSDSADTLSQADYDRIKWEVPKWHYRMSLSDI